MSKQTINIGASPNDGTGTPLRTSFDYTNQNFTELYTALGGGVGLPGATTQVIFNDGGTNLAGDAGLVYNKTTDTLTAGNATISGALTVDTTTLVVDPTNDRVGIGLASGMTAPLEVQSNTSGTSINMRGRSDNSGAMRFFANDGTTQQAYISADDTNIDILSVSTRPIRLSVNAVVVATVLNGGNVSIANGNLVMSTSGKGIDFSATADGSGTMTSELLNDYEEGVFDAFFITGGGTVTINPASNQCRYTKIGRLVTVQGSVQVSSVSSPTGPLLISGLPYTIATGAEGNAYSAMSVFPSGLEATATGQIVGYGVVGTSSIYMYRYELGTIIGLAPSAKAASEFAFSMTYSV